MTENELSERTKQLIAESNVARGVMFDAMKRFEEHVFRASWNQGYERGWEAGYNMALQRMRELADLRQAPPSPPGPVAQTPTTALPSPTAAELIFGIISASPGLRGVEIVERTSAAGESVKERTVRTALHRLKMSGKIVNVDERWYLPDAAPEPKQELPME